jgi:CubicO group peptidase (beta-lactamase class C family)
MKAKLLFLLLAVILSACAIQPTPDPKVLSAEFDALVEKNHQAGLFDGAVLVAQNGQVIFSKGYGFADRENKIPNTPQTKFLLASISKQFTAMAVLLLQEQGKLNIEDGIAATSPIARRSSSR